jgi:proteasome lid subunit RPN8/RPN11
MKHKENTTAQAPRVLIDTAVLQQIRQHARSCAKSEVCGILIGSEKGKQVEVEACIAGLNASQGGAHVTFTQDTWEHIYQIKDAEYPDHRMVGWYHSHPGFGVFLSEHDTFIHQNFFAAPLQVAWVYDPDSDEEGCFGWVGKRLERLSEIAITDRKGGEGAGESGKTEPILLLSQNDDDREQNTEPSQAAAELSPAWLRWTVTALSYVAVAVLGFALSWYLFPQILPVPYVVDIQTGRIFDPQTGQVIGLVDLRTGHIELNTKVPSAVDPVKLLPPPAVSSQPSAPAKPSAPGGSGNEKEKGKHAEQ